MNKQNTIVGYFSSQENNVCVNDRGEVIICGRMQTFPPQPPGFEFTPVTFPDLLKVIISNKYTFCLDKLAFQLYAKEFYKMTVAIISNNSAELEQMTNEEFITIKFDFLKLQSNYELN
jgi:hypothetical protein